MRYSRRAFCSALLSLAVLSPGALMAQSTYPSKAIKIIIPFPPGSGTDMSARFVAQQITQQTGQPVIVESKPGANGFIAAQAAVQAAPDGYTVFVTTMTSQSVNPFLFKKLPYDPVKDFEPVSQISLSPMMLVVRNTEDQPKTVAELTARAKKASGKMTYASGNTSSRVAAETYKHMAGVDLLHVPYKGVPQGIADMLGGQIDMMITDVGPVSALIKGGKLRALGVTGSKRLPNFPDVPTLAESGLPGIDLQTWVAAYVPAKTPKPIINRLSELINKALTSKEAAEHYGRMGNAAVPSSPSELEAFGRSELVKWGRAVKAAGIEPE